MPSSEAEVANLKMDLMRAGFRGDNALPVFYGLRIIATLVMLCLLRDAGGKDAPQPGDEDSG